MALHGGKERVNEDAGVFGHTYGAAGEGSIYDESDLPPGFFNSQYRTPPQPDQQPSLHSSHHPSASALLDSHPNVLGGAQLPRLDDPTDVDRAISFVQARGSISQTSTYPDHPRPSEPSSYLADGTFAAGQQLTQSEHDDFLNGYVTFYVGEDPDIAEVTVTYRELYAAYHELRPLISCALSSWAQRTEYPHTARRIVGSKDRLTFESALLPPQTLNSRAVLPAASLPVSGASPSMTRDAIKEHPSTLEQEPSPTSDTEPADSPADGAFHYPDAVQCVKISISGDDCVVEAAKVQQTGQSFYDALLLPSDHAPLGLDTVQTANHVKAQTRILAALKAQLNTSEGRNSALNYCLELAQTVIHVNQRGIPSELYDEYQEKRDQIRNVKARFAGLICSVRGNAVRRTITNNKHIAKDVSRGMNMSRIARDPSYELGLKLKSLKNNRTRTNKGRPSRARIEQSQANTKPRSSSDNPPKPSQTKAILAAMQTVVDPPAAAETTSASASDIVSPQPTVDRRASASSLVPASRQKRKGTQRGKNASSGDLSDSTTYAHGSHLAFAGSGV